MDALPHFTTICYRVRRKNVGISLNFRELSVTIECNEGRSCVVLRVCCKRAATQLGMKAKREERKGEITLALEKFVLPVRVLGKPRFGSKS